MFRGFDGGCQSRLVNLDAFNSIPTKIPCGINAFFPSLWLSQAWVKEKGIEVSENVIVLCPSEVISIEAPSLFQPAEAGAPGALPPFAEDAVEEMVVCLASIEAAWAASEFKRLTATLATLSSLAVQSGLKDIAHVAHEAEKLVPTNDAVALAAVIARLVRVGEASLATLLEFTYRQI